MASYNTNSATVTDVEVNHTSAQNAVFNTYELLEAIILYVPAEDILFAAKVNKTWHSVIATSLPIGKYLQKTLNVFGPLGKRKEDLEGTYIGHWFTWGKVIVHRRGRAEGIALFPTESASKWCALTRPVVIGEGRQGLDITWKGRRHGWQGWQFSLRDETVPPLVGGSMSSSTDSCFVEYLARFYRGYCRYGPPVVWNWGIP